MSDHLTILQICPLTKPMYALYHYKEKDGSVDKFTCPIIALALVQDNEGHDPEESRRISGVGTDMEIVDEDPSFYGYTDTPIVHEPA